MRTHDIEILSHLHPTFAGLLATVLQVARDIAHERYAKLQYKPTPILTDGLRDTARQQALWDQGRTKPGPIVTWAPPGTGWHEYGLAGDGGWMVYRDGKWVAEWEDDELWDIWALAVVSVGRIGLVPETEHTLIWGGNFHDKDGKPRPDKPHVEWHPGFARDMSKPLAPQMRAYAALRWREAVRVPFVAVG